MALGLLSTRLCKPVVFIRKSRTSHSMMEVVTKVDRSIGADTILMSRRAISAIFLSKFLMYFLGSSVRFFFVRLGQACKRRKS